MNWICDPGHAWLKVPIKSLFKHDIADKITIFSYLRGEYAYLEEDQDARIYLDMVKKNARDIKATHTNKYSKVRGYHSYTYDRAIYFNNASLDKKRGV